MSQRSIFEIQAEFCQCMSNSLRIEIIHILRDSPLRVNDIANKTGHLQPVISRHLGVLRNCGLVRAHRQAHEVVYQIANPKIVSICDLIKEVVIEESSRLSKLVTGSMKTT
jgi:predicted transcriptional regulator